MCLTQVNLSFLTLQTFVSLSSLHLHYLFENYIRGWSFLISRRGVEWKCRKPKNISHRLKIVQKDFAPPQILFYQCLPHIWNVANVSYDYFSVFFLFIYYSWIYYALANKMWCTTSFIGRLTKVQSLWCWLELYECLFFVEG